MENEKQALLALMLVPGIGVRIMNRLLDAFGSATEVIRADRRLLELIEGMTEKRIDAFETSMKKKQYIKKYEILVQKNIQMLVRGQEGYPLALAEIYDSPPVLFFRGNVLPGEAQVRAAVVGTRQPSSYGWQMARYFSGELAKKEVVIVSGLAKGVDASAHLGALQAGGLTYAVLGNGIDTCYPKENQKIFDQIMEQGGIISEYPPGYQAAAGNFPMRNRIISGMSDAVLVVEARKKSGSLITADYGMEFGKDVYAIPGRISDSLSEGCNHLIAQGAALCEAPEDIRVGLEHVRIVRKKRSSSVNTVQSGEVSGARTGEKTDEKILSTDKAKETMSVTQPQMSVAAKIEKQKNKYIGDERKNKVLSSLDVLPRHLSDIAQQTKLPLNELYEILLSLEEEGVILEVMKNYYMINAML